MTTIDEFRSATLGKLAQRLAHLEESVGLESLEDVNAIPVYGWIYCVSMDDDYPWSATDRIYLASSHGEVIENNSVDFDEKGARSRVCDLLGLEPESIGFAEGKTDYEDEEHPHDRCHAAWRFLYVRMDAFEAARKTKRVSVVADRGPKTQWRMVAPKAVRIKEAKFDFDLKTAKLKFVAVHDNSIEYLTEDGIKVYDNRQKPMGTSYSERKGERPILPRIDCLQAFLYDIWRGSTAEQKQREAQKQLSDLECREIIMRERLQHISRDEVDRVIGILRAQHEAQEKLRDFTGYALHRLVLDSEIARHEGHDIAEGIELLYGAPFAPAMAMLTGHGAGGKCQKRMLLRDHELKDPWKEDAMEPRYVVLTDL